MDERHVRLQTEITNSCQEKWHSSWMGMWVGNQMIPGNTRTTPGASIRSQMLGPKAPWRGWLVVGQHRKISQEFPGRYARRSTGKKRVEVVFAIVSNFYAMCLCKAFSLDMGLFVLRDLLLLLLPQWLSY